jgi:protein transport protein SEC61 subunit gamma and related proteins
LIDIKGFIESAKRVLIVSRKPDWREYMEMSKITGLGIVVIALLGFAVVFIFKFLCSAGVSALCP